MRNLLMITIICLFSLGCNDLAGRQQKAEQARREQTVEDLRKIGEEMHHQQVGESPPDLNAEQSEPVE